MTDPADKAKPLNAREIASTPTFFYPQSRWLATVVADRARIAELEEALAVTNTGGLPLLYDIRRALGWNDKTSLSILADGVRRVRRALKTWDTPTGMDLEALALAIKTRVTDLERVAADSKARIGELLEELDDARAALSPPAPDEGTMK